MLPCSLQSFFCTDGSIQYIIRRKSNSRLKDKLYLFNSFGMLVPYLVVIALNFYFRFADYEEDSCRIGMKRVAMIPLIAFDILVNVGSTIPRITNPPLTSIGLSHLSVSYTSSL